MKKNENLLFIILAYINIYFLFIFIIYNTYVIFKMSGFDLNLIQIAYHEFDHQLCPFFSLLQVHSNFKLK